jgi:glycosyltransferase involved in cell wall biosynthesis
MYAGTIGMSHGLETLLEAAKILAETKDIHIVIAGDGAEKAAVLAAMEGLDNVTYAGRKPRDVVAAMWMEADAGLVLLRKTELFKTVIPSKMFEVMAAGIPVILGVEGEALRILEETRAGIAIEPENAAELAAAIARLHASPPLCREYGDSGAACVRRDFDFDSLAARYEDLLAGVAR